jgi:hypothetical protein
MDRRAALVALAAAFGGCAALSERFGPARRSPEDPSASTGRVTTARSPAPYVAPDGVRVDDPVGLRVENDAVDRRYVTTVVADGERTVHLRSEWLPADGSLAYPDLVGSRGRYDVVVEVADGVRETGRLLAGPTTSDLVAAVADDGVTLRQDVRCTPGCPPVESAGTDRSLPDRPDGVTRPAVPLVVWNVAGSTVPVSVRVRGDVPVLDREYAVPAGTALELPAVTAPGAYDLRVDAGGAVLSGRWQVPEEAGVTVLAGDGAVDLACRRRRRAAVSLVNRDDGPHLVGVQSTRGDRQLSFELVKVAPGRRESVVVETPADGPFEVRVMSDRGEAVRTRWSLCPRPSFRVDLSAGGGLRASRDGVLLARDRPSGGGTGRPAPATSPGTAARRNGTAGRR